VGQEVAVDRDPGVGQREQRHDDVARRRVVELLQPLVGEIAEATPTRADRASSGVGCSRNSRNRSLARSRSLRSGVGVGEQPMTMPTATGSTPDSKNATQAATAEQCVHRSAMDPARPHHGDEQQIANPMIRGRP